MVLGSNLVAVTCTFQSCSCFFQLHILRKVSLRELLFDIFLFYIGRKNIHIASYPIFQSLRIIFCFALCFVFFFSSCVSPFCNQGLEHPDFCDALRDLVPFVKFKKHKKYSWRSVSVKLQTSGKLF